MGDVFCHVHAGVVAAASCRVCAAPLCDACCKVDGIVPYCADCLRKTRGSSLARPVLTFLLLCAAAGGGYGIYRKYKAPYDYGRHTSEIDKLADQLSAEPCDHPKQLALLEQMLAAGDNRGVLRRAAAFTEKCGDEPKMYASTYLAHQRLGEIDEALADLDRLVAASPTAPYPLVWRAAIREERGKLDLAAEDLEKAWSLYPAATDVPLSLSRLHERRGKLCEATVPLRGLVFRYPNEPFVVGVRARLAALDERGACGVVVTGSDTVTIRGTGSGTFLTSARLCDKAYARVVVDTGASHMVIVRSLAEQLGLDLAHAPKAKIATANGTREARLVFLSRVAIGGLSTDDVPAVVVDDLGPGIDGLLGQTFLARFELKQAGSVMELTPKRAQASASAAPATSTSSVTAAPPKP